MDDGQFDHLVRRVTSLTSRRGLLGLAVSLPILGDGLAHLAPVGVEARKHKKHKKKPTVCTPEAQATTCAGRCGSVQNNCQQTVTCTCPVCQTCADGRCQPVANATVACDGSPVNVIGNLVCTNNTSEVGVCVDGACNCGAHTYDPATKRCVCRASDTAQCAANSGPNTCCRVGQVCTPGEGGTGCVPCS